MAITVAFDGQLMHDMGDTDAATGIANASDGGGGSAPSANPDFFFQGANSIGKKVTATRAGIQADCSAFGTPRTVDVTAANRQLIFHKLQATNKAALLAFGAPAMHVQYASGGSAANRYQVEIAGNEPEFYPIRGGFVLGAINLNHAAFQSDGTGSPSLTAVNYFATLYDFTGSSKDDNAMMDAIYAGRGHTLVGSSPDGVIQDFVDYDQNTVGNRHGCFLIDDSVVKVVGMHWIGRDATPTTTLTVFNDSDKNIVFPDGHWGDGDCGFSFDTGNASTDIDINSFIVTGVGRRNRAQFDTETEMNATSDEIQNADVIAAFRPADAVFVDATGGTETPGPNGNGTTMYWVGKDMTAAPTGITLHTSRDDAALHSGGGGGGTPVALTLSGAGAGEKWRLVKANDTRPQLIGTGTSGALNIEGGTFTEIGKVTLTSVWDIANAIWNNSEQWTQNGGRIDSNTFIGHNTIEAESFIDCDDIVDVVGNSFDNTGGRGHAIEFSQTGNIAFVGNTFTGYFGVTNQLLHQFNASTDVNGTTEVITLPTGHGYVTGDAVVYSKMLTANSVISGLVEGDTYYLEVSGDDVQMHANEGDALNAATPINITAGASETHALWPANAAVFNNSGGALTLSISGGGNSPSVRNALDSTTAASVTVTLTVQVNAQDGTPVSGAKVRIVDTPEAIGKASISEGTTNGAGTYTDATYVYSGDVPVLTKVRLKGFKFFRTLGTIVDTGLTVGASLRPDKEVDLP